MLVVRQLRDRSVYHTLPRSWTRCHRQQFPTAAAQSNRNDEITTSQQSIKTPFIRDFKFRELSGMLTGKTCFIPLS